MKKVIPSSEHTHDDIPEEEKGGIIYIEKNIFLFGEISPQSTGSFVAAFKEADAKPGIITLYICSSGGWVEGGLCMYDLIKSSKNQVIAMGCGAVYSAAVLPFEASDLRIMYKSSRMLLHDMSISIGEIKYGDMSNISEQTKNLFNMSCGYIANRSKNKLKTIQELCSKDSFLSAKQCLELGLVDKLIKDSTSKFAEYGMESMDQ